MTDTPTTALTNTDMSAQATPIVSGASPTTADPQYRYYTITSGGTGGDETIDLQGFGENTNGHLSQKVIFYLETQTNASDRVVITTEGAPPYVLGRAFHNSSAAAVAAPGVILDWAGASAVFRWTGNHWLLDYAATSANDDSVFDQGESSTIYQTVPVEFTNASVKLSGIPTADPHVATAIWNNGGVLTISAG